MRKRYLSDTLDDFSYSDLIHHQNDLDVRIEAAKEIQESKKKKEKELSLKVTELQNAAKDTTISLEERNLMLSQEKNCLENVLSFFEQLNLEEDELFNQKNNEYMLKQLLNIGLLEEGDDLSAVDKRIRNMLEKLSRTSNNRKVMNTQTEQEMKALLLEKAYRKNEESMLNQIEKLQQEANQLHLK